MIHDILDSSASIRRTLANARTGYFKDGMIVIENPRVPYGGTAFPGSFDDFLKLR